MAQIIENRMFTKDGHIAFSIVGLTFTEFYTLLDILEKEKLKAADPQNNTYNDDTARPVIELANSISETKRIVLI